MYLQISCWGGGEYNKNGVSIKLSKLSEWIVIFEKINLFKMI